MEQGKEPPCFLQLFGGKMVVHAGKRGSPASSRWHLYVVRNELPEEAYLWEIPVEISNLRSRTSFVLVDRHKMLMFIWHGAKSPSDVVDRTNEIGELLKER